MTITSAKLSESSSGSSEMNEMELSDEDIIDAMKHISGYLDISTEDFRTVYHLAHKHAMGRLFSNFKAKNIMSTNIEPLLSDMFLDDAAKTIVRSGLKSLPVVDENGCVIGILTETDYLRRFKVDTFLKLLLDMLNEGFEFKHRCHDTFVREAMTTPAITLSEEAGFQEVASAFHQHNGRSTPIVDINGRLLGVILRQDFFAAFNMDTLN